MILVLSQTGLRVSEALGLTLQHLSRHPGTVEYVNDLTKAFPEGGRRHVVRPGYR